MGKYKKFNLNQLRKKCTDIGIKSNGTRAVLIERLSEYYKESGIFDEVNNFMAMRLQQLEETIRQLQNEKRSTAAEIIPKSENLYSPPRPQHISICKSSPMSLSSIDYTIQSTSCSDPQSITDFIEQESAEDPNVNQVLPDLEEHDKAGLKFELNLMPQQKGKVNWFYSKPSNKVYIKLNEIFNVEVVYKPRSQMEKIFIRAMMVFNSEVSEPVVRCENHSSKDPVTQKNIKHSVLRCENSNVIYKGDVKGKNISDRLSVRLPLSCIQPNDEDFVKQTIALKFVCQNSCVGRRETSVIFYLENASGEVLGKRTTNVKICSCPKRDMKKDEETQMPKKRSRKDECPVGKKILKLDNGIKEEPGQEEYDEDDSVTSTTEVSDITITPNGVRVTMELPDMDAASHVYECAFNKVAGQMALDPDNAKTYSKIIKSIKKGHAKSKRLLHVQQN